jgi:dipeptidyl aminopeptidase/acylaminoacyl peptidase
VWVYSAITDPDNDAYPVAVFRLDDGSETRLTADDAAGAPSISPDGDQIVFERGSDGDPESAGYATYRLYVMNDHGGSKRPLLGSAYEVPERDDFAPAGDQNPMWSPDGSHVAFIRYGHLADPNRGRVMVVSPDGGAPRALPGNANSGDPAPAWSSDGSRVAWVTTPFDATTSTLHWAAVDGSDSGSVILSEDVYGTPAWIESDRAIAMGYFAEDDADLADAQVLRVDVASSHTETVDLPLANLWTLPTGQLAGFESDADSHTLMVVDDLDDPGAAEEITTIGRSPMLPEGAAYDRDRGSATAVPDDPDGWAACTP